MVQTYNANQATIAVQFSSGPDMTLTLPDLVIGTASKLPDHPAIKHKSDVLTYSALAAAIDAFADGLLSLQLARLDRVAILCGKQTETVIAMFGAARAGCAFVPVNPLFKPAQIAYILGHCNVRALITTQGRFNDLKDQLEACPDLRHVVFVDDARITDGPGSIRVHRWRDLLSQKKHAVPRMIASDMAAIMYTSGSTGKPKGVVLSHANLTIGASSVATYLDNTPGDRILAALPFSFDAGLSQLTTGFLSGAQVVLHEYLLPRDVVRIVEKERITGITGVPPLWIQLAEQKWPPGGGESLRYFANTGGKMPRTTLARLREIFPSAAPYLMYGLTEAFRSTYLPPAEVDRRPDSIGMAIPNVEVLVVRDDGSACLPGETGELVHRGPLVSMGYWNDPARTEKRFRPAPGQPGGIVNPDLAVWSGDKVKCDEDGYLYFVGRQDDMIKTSGYRVSPTEVEEVCYGTGHLSEVVAIGMPNERLGQEIVLVAKAGQPGGEPTEALLAALRNQLPTYMVPLSVHWWPALPRNANGKIDRPAIVAELMTGKKERERA